ncbi:hypothetical protein DM860_012877 [Cuscuta australis]|uniref:Retrotransposon Copia-like N-terminal domain-containing protein n=1 Tax=Cuscuta australis TaxID=267555 RepID=A0A328DUR2_9ASTE|nr:hypothetical protein DM860_012877 [Cuscuta australis]
MQLKLRSGLPVVRLRGLWFVIFVGPHPHVCLKAFPIKLTKTNYLVWRCQFQTTLVGLDLIGYVDGLLKAPSPFLDTAHKQRNPAYTLWYRQDVILLTVILSSCTDVVQPQIPLADTLADAWSRLTKNPANMSCVRIISLKSQLAKNHRGNRTIDAFVAYMTTIASNLALAVSLVTDEDLSVHIMSRIGKDYSTLYQSWWGVMLISLSMSLPLF